MDETTCPVFFAGDAVSFRDAYMPERGAQAATVAEVLLVPSGRLYVLALANGGQCSPVFAEEMTPSETAEPDAKTPRS